MPRYPFKFTLIPYRKLSQAAEASGNQASRFWNFHLCRIVRYPWSKRLGFSLGDRDTLFVVIYIIDPFLRKQKESMTCAQSV